MLISVSCFLVSSLSLPAHIFINVRWHWSFPVCSNNISLWFHDMPISHVWLSTHCCVHPFNTAIIRKPLRQNLCKIIFWHLSLPHNWDECVHFSKWSLKPLYTISRLTALEKFPRWLLWNMILHFDT